MAIEIIPNKTGKFYVRVNGQFLRKGKDLYRSSGPRRTFTLEAAQAIAKQDRVDYSRIYSWNDYRNYYNVVICCLSNPNHPSHRRINHFKKAQLLSTFGY